MKNFKLMLMMALVVCSVGVHANDQLDLEEASGVEAFLGDVKESFKVENNDLLSFLKNEQAAQQLMQGFEQLEEKTQKRGLQKGFISNCIADCATISIEFIDIIPTGLGDINEDEKDCLKESLRLIVQCSAINNDLVGKNLFAQKMKEHVAKCRERNESLLVKINAAQEDNSFFGSLGKEKQEALSQAFDAKLKEKNAEFLSLQVQSATLAAAYRSEAEKAFEKSLE